MPSYQGEYEAMVLWAEATADKLSLHHLEFVEAGNGTLRGLQVGVNKGTALARMGLDLSQVIFIGNGLNDLPAAHAVFVAGGLVMTVANGVPQLKQLAWRVANQPAAEGVVELLDLLME